MAEVKSPNTEITWRDEKGLAKININNTDYIVKDKQAREELDKLRAAAYKDVVAEVTANAGLPTAAAVKNYVDSQVGTIHNFDVVALDSKENLPIASQDTMFKIYLVPEVEPVALAVEVNSAYEEYITIKSSEVYSWEKIGSTRTELINYVQKTRKLSDNLDLTKDHTSAEWKKELGLQALAYKNNATVQVTDYATGVAPIRVIPSVASPATATIVNGDATVEVSGTANVSGNVTGGTVTAKGTIKLEKELLTDNADAIQLGGTISKPSIDITPDQKTIKPIASLGTQASIVGQNYIAQSINSNDNKTVPENAFIASVAEETETLTLSAAKTVSVLGSATTLSEGDVDFGIFTPNELPAYGSEVNVLGAGAQAELNAAPEFTGEKIKATFSGVAADLTGASFADADAVVNASGTYQKANESANVNITFNQIDITPELQKGNKDIIVQ